ncbi:MAG: hypothetical protein ACYST3_05980 [Planctomycetota bacterium]
MQSDWEKSIGWEGEGRFKEYNWLLAADNKQGKEYGIRRQIK